MDQPWIGGNPRPEPNDGLELFADQTLNSLYDQPRRKVMDGRHPDRSCTCVTASDIQTCSATRFEPVRALEVVRQSGADDPKFCGQYLIQRPCRGSAPSERDPVVGQSG